MNQSVSIYGAPWFLFLNLLINLFFFIIEVGFNKIFNIYLMNALRNQKLINSFFFFSNFYASKSLNCIRRYHCKTRFTTICKWSTTRTLRALIRPNIFHWNYLWHILEKIYILRICKIVPSYICWFNLVQLASGTFNYNFIFFLKIFVWTFVSV